MGPRKGLLSLFFLPRPRGWGRNDRPSTKGSEEGPPPPTQGIPAWGACTDFRTKKVAILSALAYHGFMPLAFLPFLTRLRDMGAEIKKWRHGQPQVLSPIQAPLGGRQARPLSPQNARGSSEVAHGIDGGVQLHRPPELSNSRLCNRAILSSKREEVISDGCIAEAPGDPDATGDAPGA